MFCIHIVDLGSYSGGTCSTDVGSIGIPTGLTKTDYESFYYDEVSRTVKNNSFIYSTDLISSDKFISAGTSITKHFAGDETFFIYYIKDIYYSSYYDSENNTETVYDENNLDKGHYYVTETSPVSNYPQTIKYNGATYVFNSVDTSMFYAYYINGASYVTYNYRSGKVYSGRIEAISPTKYNYFIHNLTANISFNGYTYTYLSNDSSTRLYYYKSGENYLTYDTVSKILYVGDHNDSL